MSCDRCRDVSVGLKGRSSSGLRGLNSMMVTAVCRNKKFHKTWFGFQKNISFGVSSATIRVFRPAAFRFHSFQKVSSVMTAFTVASDAVSSGR